MSLPGGENDVLGREHVAGLQDLPVKRDLYEGGGEEHITQTQKGKVTRVFS